MDKNAGGDLEASGIVMSFTESGKNRDLADEENSRGEKAYAEKENQRGDGDNNREQIQNSSDTKSLSPSARADSKKKSTRKLKKLSPNHCVYWASKEFEEATEKLNTRERATQTEDVCNQDSANHQNERTHDSSSATDDISETQYDSAHDDDDDGDSDVDFSDYNDDLWEDWENEMLQADCPNRYYAPYRRYLVKILNPTARKYLSDNLNDHIESVSRHGLQRNWYGIAQCIGKDIGYVIKMDRFNDPFGEMLRDWQTEAGSTIGQLIHYLAKMDRFDIIDDKIFMDAIYYSVEVYDKERNKHAREREEARKERLAQRNRTSWDLDSTESSYNALVVYSEDSIDFLMELIHETETKQNQHLCLDATELLEEGQISITAEQIIAKCRRIIVILSESLCLHGNEMFDFCMRVVQSLSPAISRSKVLPIRTDRAAIPENLTHLTQVDFTNYHERTWLWRKVYVTLGTPRDKIPIMERQKLRHAHLVPKENETDVRAKMREMNYEPPIFERGKRQKFPKVKKEGVDVPERPSGYNFYTKPGTSFKERIISKKKQLERCLNTLTSKKQEPKRDYQETQELSN